MISSLCKQIENTNIYIYISTRDTLKKTCVYRSRNNWNFLKYKSSKYYNFEYNNNNQLLNGKIKN